MKRSLLAALLLCSGIAFGQATITGHVSDLGNSTSGTYAVRFDLANCGGSFARVSGQKILLPYSKTFTASSGVISGSLWGNDVIQCSGAFNSYYSVTLLYNGQKVGTAQNYIIPNVGTWNFDTANPVSITPPNPVIPYATFNPRGAYDPTKSYGVNDIVTYSATGETSTYRAKKTSGPSNPINPTSDASVWELLVQGTAGPAGQIGATGPGVARGGGTGQVLAKVSDADFDTHWIAAVGSGTVTDLTASVPSWLRVTVTNSTTVPNIAITAATGLTGNQVLATPDGSSGGPSFRALTPNDIPTLAEAKIANLAADLAAKAPLASPTFTGTATFSNVVINGTCTGSCGSAGGSFATLTGQPTDNTALATALNAKANTSSLATVATSGSYTDLSNPPTIPAAQVSSDWNSVTSPTMILNKPTIPTSASWPGAGSCTNLVVTGINNGALPTCGSVPSNAIPPPSGTTLGGVQSKICTGTDKISSIGTDGVPVCSTDQTTTGGTGITSINGASQGTQTITGGTNITVNTNTATGATSVALSGTVAKANGGAGADMSSVTFPGSGTIATTANLPGSFTQVAGQWINSYNSATKTFAASAPTATEVGLGNVPNVNATNASNISSGTLPAGRLPAFTGECTSTAGTAALTCGTAVAHTGVDINTSNQVTATHLASPLPKAQGGAGADMTSVTFPSSGTLATTAQLPSVPITTIQGNGTALTPTAGAVNVVAGANITVTPSGNSITIAGASGGNTTSTSLTTNKIPKANGANSVVDSAISDDGTTLTYSGTGGISLPSGASNIPSYTNTSPTDGDFWPTSGNWFYRVSGASKQFAYLDSSITGTAAGITGKTLQGTGTLVPLATGSATVNKQLTYDASGNIVVSAYDVGSATGGSESTPALSETATAVVNSKDFIESATGAGVITFTEGTAPTNCDSAGTACAATQANVFVDSTTHQLTCKLGAAQTTSCMPNASMVYPAAGVAVSTGSAWVTSLTAPTGAIVGTTDIQTLTNKTLDGVSPTTMGYLDATSSIQTQLNAKAGFPASGIPVSTGTAWTTSKATPTGTIVGDTDTQTLSGKTLTSPTINTPTFGAASYIKDVFHFGCPGTGGTATWYMPLWGGATWTCASATTATGGMPVGSTGTLKNLNCKSSAAAKNGSDGAITVNRNATSGGALTCTIGTGTSCADTTHTIAVTAASDYIVVSVTGASSETLANLNCSMELWN